ncbi:MAG TPA: hydantoinase/oxoprolinase family protein [Candidatus Dormibacteraeota bacterium]|nr:hydantoinase/oxoprolinase family protein [Candidatus Dormibacteraeota bacterium]
MTRYRLGVDIGGTFTDGMLIDEATGEVSIAKVLSTPADPAAGFLEATARIVREDGVRPADVRFVVHGTTVATNAIIEGRTARTGFVTTEGFRDMLEIARQTRPSLYDLRFEKPPPLVGRDLAFGIPERLDAEGRVLAELDEGAVREAARELGRLGVESVAVCLLHSYVNPSHERRVAELIGEELPGVLVSISSDVAPEIREYLRASTTVINASIRPVVAGYLANVEARLRDAGIAAELLVMQSSGGVYSSRAAGERPAFMVESGPAAGVIAAAALGAGLDRPEIISFDMGGTTAKVGLIRGGEPTITKEYQVGASAHAGIAGLAASGYPLRTPVIDLVEIGAGGGSIAWVDSGGMLRVGPRSAGADPGPVCYGRGGTEPTISDANVVLGRLDPDYFLGGEIPLDVERARDAIERRCAEQLGMGVIACANGIIEIANAAMVNALHLVSVQRGYDPRHFALVAFGGAGPVHANTLARDTAIPEVIVPPRPGIFSAMGLLSTDLRRDHLATFLRPAAAIDPVELEAAFQRLESGAVAELRAERMADADIASSRFLDVRYLGQSYELPIPVQPGAFGAGALAAAERHFHQEHERAYGHSAPEEPLEVVSVRVVAVGRIARPEPRAVGKRDEPAPRTLRPVYFAELDGFTDCPIYDRYSLGEGARISGPAIVEELDSTTVLHPGYAASVDRHGNLLITTGNEG